MDNNEKLCSDYAGTVPSGEEETADPLMGDCFQLCQRLIETEESLIPCSLNKVQSSPQSDSAPVLTLADLTPAQSETGCMDSFHMHSSLREERTRKEQLEKDKKNSSTFISVYSHSLTDNSCLRKKLSTLREENSALFIQNNKLLTQLENASFQLQQSREKLKEVNENEWLKEYDKTISNLKQQIHHKNYAINELKAVVEELRHHLKEIKDQEREDIKSFGEKIKQSWDTINDLSEKYALSQNTCESHFKQTSELEKISKELKSRLDTVTRENSDVRDEFDSAKAECMELQEQKMNLQAELLALHGKASQLDDVMVENKDLKSIIEEQQKKLTDYADEVEKTKEHMQRLEVLIQKIQDDKLTLRTDSGINGSFNLECGSKCTVSSNNDIVSSRSIIADLKLKMAVKDSELHQLQALVASNTFSQQKMKNDFCFDGSTLLSLRSELCSVIEHSRDGDKKRAELEQTITRLEIDLSAKTSQILELEEQVSGKTVLISTLENTLFQRNNKIMSLQQENERTDEKINQTNDQLKIDYARKDVMLQETEKKLKEACSLKEVYGSKLSQLELALQAHNAETKATDSLVDKMKSLHADHCRELEDNIEKLRQHVEEKTIHIVKLENKFSNALKESQMKDISASDMSIYLKKLEELVAEKEMVIEKYEQKAKTLENKLKLEVEHVDKLKITLNGYKKELSNTMKQLEQDQVEYQDIIKGKSSEVKGLEITITRLEDGLEMKNKLIEDLEKSYNQSLEMLEQSQKHITELEDAQVENEKELSRLKENMSQEKCESDGEVVRLEKNLAESNEKIELYLCQMNEMNDALEEAKIKFVELGGSLESKDEKLLEQSHIILEKMKVMETLATLNTDFEKELQERREDCRRYESKFAEIDELKKKQDNELLLAKDDAETYHKQLYRVEKQVEYLIKESNGKDESISKVERMLAISQDEISIKDMELKDRSVQLEETEALLNEMQLELKHKSAQFTQMEMSFKNDKSEYEKKVSDMEGNLSQLQKNLHVRNIQLQELNNQYMNLKVSLDDKNRLCEEYEEKFKIQEEGNNLTSLHMVSLKQELEVFQSKVHNQIDLEDEILALRQQLQKMLKDFQNVETQLMTSQQTVIELTKELDELHSMLAMKEAHCTRLARQLGASQVREAQEKAHLNQRLRKVVQEKEFTFSQKSEEVDLMRNRHEDEVISQQQEIMKLKLSFQRTEDENRLVRHDLDRSMLRIAELEEDVKCLTKQLQLEQQKCKEMSEVVIIREAEAARCFARLSSYERASFSNRPNSSLKSHSDHSTFKLGETSKKTPGSSPNTSLSQMSSTTTLSPNASFIGTSATVSCLSGNIEDSFDSLIKRTEEEFNIASNSHTTER